MKHARTKLLTALLASSLVLTASGGAAQGADAVTVDDTSTPASAESYIDYLHEHHAEYASAFTGQTPVAEYDDTNMALRWTITAQTEDQAEKLRLHVEYMKNKIEGSGHPRPWDKLFLMDAYLGNAHRYHTTVSAEGTQVVIDKVAEDACSYAAMKTHAEGVSGQFFGVGDINVSFTPLAEQILASDACAADRAAIEAYIDANLEPLPDGITVIGD